MINYLKKLYIKIVDYDRLNNDYKEIIKHSTKGKLEHTHYSVDVIKSMIDG